MKTIKELLHLCFTSHAEVLCRDQEDFATLTNSIAITSYRDGTEILADAVMSTHCHLMAFADNAASFVQRVRHSYAYYFNRKYHRNGLLGEKYYYASPVLGKYHRLACASYIMRNGQHHGQSASAFAYPYCTTPYLYAQDLHLLSANKHSPIFPEQLITNHKDMMEHLPRDAKFPDEWRMDKSGMFLRSSFEQIGRVEEWYGTPRQFLYYMNRLSGDEWANEQKKDGSGGSAGTFCLETLEPGYGEKDIVKMLGAEKGYHQPNRLGSDIEICHLIDKELIRPFHKDSIYQLSEAQRVRIGNTLLFDYHVNPTQIPRCLALEPGSFSWKGWNQ